MREKAIKLSELNKRILNATNNAFPDPFWIIAEILELDINRSGHCYLELIEKSETDESIIAKSRATIWSSRFSMLRSYFETTTGTKLESGLSVLLKSNVSFHPVYGLSLNVTDIDPAYTLGEIALRKQEIINKLITAGVINMNKELQLSEIPQNIAIISSETAAGYGDFIDSLLRNSYHFRFHVYLFPAVMQGTEAGPSIISALEKIYNSGLPLDAVALIRGGGSKSDLDCFNSYDLAMNIAQFPIPVLTGIGHDRDETIADIVAFKSLKTPTAVAEFLIDSFLEFSEYVKSIQDRFEQDLKWIIQQEKVRLQQSASHLNYLVKNYILKEENYLATYKTAILKNSDYLLKKEGTTLNNISGKLQVLSQVILPQKKHDLAILEEKSGRIFRERIKKTNIELEGLGKTFEILRPEGVLARGYSISYIDGKVLKSIKQIKKGTKMYTKIKNGSISSIVEETKELTKK